jgi:hypothetical protein
LLQTLAASPNSPANSCPCPPKETSLVTEATQANANPGWFCPLKKKDRSQSLPKDESKKPFRAQPEGQNPETHLMSKLKRADSLRNLRRDHLRRRWRHIVQTSPLLGLISRRRCCESSCAQYQCHHYHHRHRHEGLLTPHTPREEHERLNEQYQKKVRERTGSDLTPTRENSRKGVARRR